MQNAVDLKLANFYEVKRHHFSRSGRFFALSLVICTLASACMASWLPLQMSVVTVFLFAGPHNWFELRYFLKRMPVRFGKSRSFFLTAFAGIGLLTTAYIAMPFVYNATYWSEPAWLLILASWNTLLLVWLGTLVWLRGKQKTANRWGWAFPLVFALSGLNWLSPEFFSLTIVYIHPIIALWFLDRHLARTRREWLPLYRRCLALLLLVLAVMIWGLSNTPSLNDDNGLFWRITQHSGAQLLPGVSTHLLVSVHLFLEMLHYGVWLLALPLIGPAVLSSTRERLNGGSLSWFVRTIPVARHPRGFPKTILAVTFLALIAVAILWAGFVVDYSTTRDVYFTVAMAHVLAEAPFLLKMI